MIEDPVFWMVAVAVALPLWATLRIARSDLPKQRKITSLVGAWVMPVIGPIAMLIEVPRRGRACSQAGVRIRRRGRRRRASAEI